MTQQNTIHTNPCFKEHNISLKCLDVNNYDGDQCKNEFENYKNCKKFWGQVQRIRRGEGIKPALPNVEDREKVKAEYWGKIRI